MPPTTSLYVGTNVVSFCLLAELPSFDAQRPFHPLPDLHTFEAFLRWLARQLKGRNDPNGKLTVGTVRKLQCELNLCIHQETGQRYPGELNGRLRKVVPSAGSVGRPDADKAQVIDKDMPISEQLSTKARDKWLAGPPVVKDILNFLWTLDEYEYKHPRVRPQLALSLLLFLYIGLRPGEFVESNGYRQSDDGLHWGDVEFMMVPGRDRQPIWRVQLRLRFRKNNRKREDKMCVPLARCHKHCVLTKLQHLRKPSRSERVKTPVSGRTAVRPRDSRRCDRQGHHRRGHRAHSFQRQPNGKEASYCGVEETSTNNSKH